MWTEARFTGRKGRTRALVTSLLLGAATPWTGLETAHAEEPDAASAEQREAATHAFEEGEAAFRIGDFLRAGEAFERAYRASPHPAPLWNAARSYERAGELARAANVYARYLREAPEGAPDRREAQAALGGLAKKLGLVEIYTKDATDVRLDDKPAPGPRVYVNPGTHVLEGRVKGHEVRVVEDVEAGGVRNMALVDVSSDKLEVTAIPPKSEANKPAPPRPAAEVKAPAWMIPALVAGGAATATSVGLLVWSGLDTLAARRDFDGAPSLDKLEAGKDKQLRTNVLLGSSIGLGVFTGVVASLWLAKHREERPRVAVTPTLPAKGSALGVVVSGSF